MNQVINRIGIGLRLLVFALWYVVKIAIPCVLLPTHIIWLLTRYRYKEAIILAIIEILYVAYKIGGMKDE